MAMQFKTHGDGRCGAHTISLSVMALLIEHAEDQHLERVTKNNAFYQTLLDKLKAQSVVPEAITSVKGLAAYLKTENQHGNTKALGTVEEAITEHLYQTAHAWRRSISEEIGVRPSQDRWLNVSEVVYLASSLGIKTDIVSDHTTRYTIAPETNKAMWPERVTVHNHHNSHWYGEIHSDRPPSLTKTILQSKETSTVDAEKSIERTISTTQRYWDLNARVTAILDSNMSEDEAHQQIAKLFDLAEKSDNSAMPTMATLLLNAEKSDRATADSSLNITPDQ